MATSPSILICAHEHDRIVLMNGHARKLAARIQAGEPETVPDAETARQLLTSTPHDLQLVIIDARLPRNPLAAPDFTGEEALKLAEWLRDNCEKPPIMIVTEQTPAPPEINSYCVPDNCAIALPLKQLQSFSRVFEAFFDMLQKKPMMTWNTIEVSVRGKSATCHLSYQSAVRRLNQPSSAPVQWGVVTADPLKRAAKKFERRDKLPVDWIEEIRDDGLQLFENLIKGPLGAGFFAHIERAAGSLSGLAFRFKVEEADLHAAPFEALGRPDESNLNTSPFILLHAPVARQVTGVMVSPRANERPLPRPARMLFVRSQVANNPAGMVLRDTVGLPIVDPRTGKSHVSFEALRNIDRELSNLTTLKGTMPLDELEITPLDLSSPENTGDAAAALRRELKRYEYHIVHFAGHSKTIGCGSSASTYLILPGAKVGEAMAFPIENFADTLGRAKYAWSIYLHAKAVRHEVWPAWCAMACPTS